MPHEPHIPGLRHALRNPAGRIERDVDDEIAFHIESRVGELMATGVSEESARRHAEGNGTAALVFAATGELEAGVKYGARARDLSGRSTVALAMSAVVEGARGDRRRADAYHAELLARARFDDVTMVSLAMSAGAAGRADDAMEYALRAAEDQEMLRGTLIRWPWFATLRDHQRSAELHAKLLATTAARGLDRSPISLL